jgi:hypothetical protein
MAACPGARNTGRATGVVGAANDRFAGGTSVPRTNAMNEETRMTELGVGAPGRETENHFLAIGRREGPEAERAARERARHLRLGIKPVPASPAKSGALKPLHDLLAFIADPAASRELLEQLERSTQDAHDATDRAFAAKAELDDRAKTHQGELDTAREDHLRRLSRERTEFDEDCKRRDLALTQREGAMQAAEDRLKAATEAAERARADFERRLTSLNNAAAAADQ